MIVKQVCKEGTTNVHRALGAEDASEPRYLECVCEYGFILQFDEFLFWIKPMIINKSLRKLKKPNKLKVMAPVWQKTIHAKLSSTTNGRQNYCLLSGHNPTEANQKVSQKWDPLLGK